jgi:hydrogenase maturation protease
MRLGEVDDQDRNRVSPRNAVSSFPRTLIIGYGSPLRGDDALGPQVAEQLSERFSKEPRVQVQIVHQLTFDLAESLSNFGLVVLIDARKAKPVGECYVQEIQPSQEIPQPFSHYLNPQELLSICQILYSTQPEIILIGINAVNFEVGDPISRLVQNRIPELIEKIEALL